MPTEQYGPLSTQGRLLCKEQKAHKHGPRWITSIITEISWGALDAHFQVFFSFLLNITLCTFGSFFFTCFFTCFCWYRSTISPHGWNGSVMTRCLACPITIVVTNEHCDSATQSEPPTNSVRRNVCAHAIMLTIQSVPLISKGKRNNLMNMWYICFLRPRVQTFFEMQFILALG